MKGKGRKERCIPLTRQSVAVLRTWMRERQGETDQPLFPTIRGTALSRDAVSDLVTKHTETARARCPTLTVKKVTPHTLRHSCAMALLAAGVDTSVIASVARPRADPDDADLSARGPDHQGTGVGAHAPTEDDAGPLPGPRHTARLPRGSMNMPGSSPQRRHATSHNKDPPLPTRHIPEPGILDNSEVGINHTVASPIRTPPHPMSTPS